MGKRKENKKENKKEKDKERSLMAEVPSGQSFFFVSTIYYTGRDGSPS